MIYVLTAHYGSGHWIAQQQTCLGAYIEEPFRVLCSVEGFKANQVLPASTSTWEVVEQRGDHAAKLNQLARRALCEAKAHDILLFLDGDALPIANLSDIIGICRDGELVAIRRDENLGDPIPHPSFCAVRVDIWRELPGDWSPGPTWVNSAGRSVSDVGALLWANLRARRVDWTPLLRTRTHHLHAVWFGVYGDLVYHHGAGFRFPVCRHDSVTSEAYGDSPEAQATWCHERGLVISRLGDKLYARIAADPLRTLERCKDGSLFQGLGDET